MSRDRIELLEARCRLLTRATVAMGAGLLGLTVVLVISLVPDPSTPVSDHPVEPLQVRVDEMERRVQELSSRAEESVDPVRMSGQVETAEVGDQSDEQVASSSIGTSSFVEAGRGNPAQAASGEQQPIQIAKPLLEWMSAYTELPDAGASADELWNLIQATPGQPLQDLASALQEARQNHVNELKRRLLDDYPDHPYGFFNLRALVSSVDDPADAWRLIERYGPWLRLPDWELNQLRSMASHLSGDPATGLQYLQEVVGATGTPDGVREEVSWSIAELLYERERLSEARAAALEFQRRWPKSRKSVDDLLRRIDGQASR